MWQLVTLGICGIAYLIRQRLKEDVQAEYERWNSTHSEVQERIRRHREEIAGHLKSARLCVDFHTECELHFASVKLANEAYRLLRDAKVTETGIRKTIRDVKANMEDIYRKTKAPGLSRFDRDELHSQLADLKQLKAGLVEDANVKAKEVERFHEEVRQLNENTHRLKCTIRDRCGRRGARANASQTA